MPSRSRPWQLWLLIGWCALWGGFLVVFTALAGVASVPETGLGWLAHEVLVLFGFGIVLLGLAAGLHGFRRWAWWGAVALGALLLVTVVLGLLGMALGWWIELAGFRVSENPLEIQLGNLFFLIGAPWLLSHRDAFRKDP